MKNCVPYHQVRSGYAPGHMPTPRLPLATPLFINTYLSVIRNTSNQDYLSYEWDVQIFTNNFHNSETHDPEFKQELII